MNVVSLMCGTVAVSGNPAQHPVDGMSWPHSTQSTGGIVPDIRTHKSGNRPTFSPNLHKQVGENVSGHVWRARSASHRPGKQTSPTRRRKCEIRPQCTEYHRRRSRSCCRHSGDRDRSSHLRRSTCWRGQIDARDETADERAHSVDAPHIISTHHESETETNIAQARGGHPPAPLLATR